MTQLELTAEEMTILEETLQRSLGDLEEEIGHTDSHEFKEMLKHRKRLLEHLLGKVSGAAVPG